MYPAVIVTRGNRNAVTVFHCINVAPLWHAPQAHLPLFSAPTALCIELCRVHALSGEMAWHVHD